MDQFMKRAIDLALNNVEEGGNPFGAVLVKNDEIVAEGVNELHHTYDVSGHAELIAIRKAQAELKTLDLGDYTLYASGEPCPMCMAAIYMSGIKKVYYCGSIERAKEVGLGASEIIYKELALPRGERSIEIIHMPLEEDAKDPMVEWSSKDK
ncbi:nucleoside deaminase [Lederbergia lenta]|uniref:Cytidine/deoxycytidylate deaminase family protein guanine deaminase n=1 Tax=Lederbergia lenta TaxID=1467 RepID=A0A2X4WH18_LEDLE|nr:nucleoside deaminase [Lederbergia lenta]MCM3112215.1 nucleoside deaminase [Lederbergia lenta]MEC2323383.1 nucleoside deaminase [Lederbergia lenta]SQI63336.1 cytidine/deoxycytidylate deaminase family protein; guanine deaminase [Lederbergia lenta]